ncbi:hypothetical protein FFI16_009815 [Pseudomonas sp. KBS0710]|nr:hypothetical protein FFI16_009815 [Pseudomonas sp. KBS0710]
MPEVLCRGSCARDTFGYAGFVDNRSVNPRTAATLPLLDRERWQLHLSTEFHHDQRHPQPPSPSGLRHQHSARSRLPRDQPLSQPRQTHS